MVNSMVSRAGCSLCVAPWQIRRAATGSWIGSLPALSVGTVASLAPERLILQGKGVPTAVINTIQCACAPSTSSLYADKWGDALSFKVALLLALVSAKCTKQLTDLSARVACCVMVTNPLRC